jgi:hypothetical protein
VLHGTWDALALLDDLLELMFPPQPCPASAHHLAVHHYT